MQIISVQIVTDHKLLIKIDPKSIQICIRLRTKINQLIIVNFLSSVSSASTGLEPQLFKITCNLLLLLKASI